MPPHIPTGTETPCEIPAVIVCEVKALLKYASDRGIDAAGLIIVPLHEAVRSLEDQKRNEAPVPAQDARLLGPESTRVLELYTKLASLTAPVNGKTVLDTESRFKSAVSPLYQWSIVFLVLAIGNEILRMAFADFPEPEDFNWTLALMDFQRYVLTVCEPFLWGALGSCVYILKRLNDLAEDRTFDVTSARGWTPRILLGAILGGAVQYLYDSSHFQSDGLSLAANALGFLTGVGVKVVYGAIEKTIEVLAGKLNLESIRTTRAKPDAVRTYLAEQLAKVDPVADPVRRQTILELMDDASKR